MFFLIEIPRYYPARIAAQCDGRIRQPEISPLSIDLLQRIEITCIEDAYEAAGYGGSKWREVRGLAFEILREIAGKPRR